MTKFLGFFSRFHGGMIVVLYVFLTHTFAPSRRLVTSPCFFLDPLTPERTYPYFNRTIMYARTRTLSVGMPAIGGLTKAMSRVGDIEQWVLTNLPSRLQREDPLW